MEQLTILYSPCGWALLDETFYQLAAYPTEAAARSAAARRVRLLAQGRRLVVHDGERWDETNLSPAVLAV